MKKHLDLLGMPVRSLVHGSSGVVTSVSFEVAGCVMAYVDRGFDDEGKKLEGQWIDTKLLVTTGPRTVSDVPDFGDPPGGDVRKPATSIR